MEEIKSVRVRVFDISSLDFKLTLYRVNNNKRKVVITPSGRLSINEMDFGFRSRNDSDDSIINQYLSTMVKLGHLSPEHQIIQDPWSDIQPKERSFGFDPYYLNNGSKVLINWVNDQVYVAGGKSWSDSEGNELEETEGGDSKSFITKTVTITSDNDKTITLSSYGLVVLFEWPSTEYMGHILDKTILQQVIFYWKMKVPNYNLELCSPDNEFCNIIEYISPLDDENLPDDEEDNVIPEESKTTKEKLSVVLPSGINVKVKEDISIKIYVGEPPVVNSNLEGFDFGDEFEEDLELLGDEYKEEGFEGEESTLVDGTTVMLFNTVELERDEGGNYDSGVVNTGGSLINTPSSNVASGSVTLPTDLKGVQNSNIITKQSLGNSKYRSITKDIISPQGKKILGSSIVKNINEFINDVLGPFATFLKSKYPSLYKSWYITSATRGYIPNGGSTTSQHLNGQAIDSQILGSRAGNPGKNIELLNAILEWYKDNPVGYGQILFETRGNSCWIHWSYSRSYNKIQLKRFKSDRTLTSAQINTTGKYVLPPVNESLLGFT